MTCSASCMPFSLVGALQLISVMQQTISALVDSAVTVTITSVTSGSVVVATDVLFLEGYGNDADTYVSALTSGTIASLFGSAFGAVTVDTSSVSITSVATAGEVECFGRTSSLSFVIHSAVSFALTSTT